jgi:hypothetical protein
LCYLSVFSKLLNPRWTDASIHKVMVWWCRSELFRLLIWTTLEQRILPIWRWNRSSWCICLSYSLWCPADSCIRLGLCVVGWYAVDDDSFYVRIPKLRLLVQQWLFRRRLRISNPRPLC